MKEPFEGDEGVCEGDEAVFWSVSCASLLGVETGVVEGLSSSTGAIARTQIK